MENDDFEVEYTPAQYGELEVGLQSTVYNYMINTPCAEIVDTSEDE